MQPTAVHPQGPGSRDGSLSRRRFLYVGLASMPVILGACRSDDRSLLAPSIDKDDRQLAKPGWQLWNDFAFYSQRDPGWKDEKLGTSSKTTIGAAGCVLTCMAMCYHAWGYRDLNPKRLNEWGRANDAFSGDLALWNKIDDYGRTRTATLIGPGDYYDYVRRGWPVVVYVWSRLYRTTHAYLLFGYSRNGDARYWVKDPLQDAASQDQPLEGDFRKAYVFTW